MPQTGTIENAGGVTATVYAPLVINPVFGDTITGLTGTGSDPTTATQIETAVNAAIAFLDGNFTSDVPAIFNNGTISNSVTVNIQFDYGQVNGNAFVRGDGVAQSQSSGTVYTSYAELRSAVSGVLTDLPATDPTNGGGFLVPQAQEKLLGITGNATAVDGYVGLNTIANGVTMDYNLANQSIAGETGVLGAIEHEITEVFGRIAIDGTEAEQQTGGGATSTQLYSILDLFRFTAPGRPAVTLGPLDYFSLNNGTTDLGVFNNLTNGGDAGDWAASVVADSFDAFLTTGTAGTISALDRMVLDAIGFQPAPTGLSIGGTVANQTTNDTSSLSPFANVAITDGLANQIETVTVTLSFTANGGLANLGGGSYNAATGVYTVSGSAAAVSLALDGLQFIPTAHQAAAGQTITTGFTINVTDSSGASASDASTSVIVTETAIPTATVAAAYAAILRAQPGTALLNATVAQIAAGQLTLAQFETGLIAGEQDLYTTLPALVTIDAFYNATPSGALLTTVATATSGTSYATAAELHDLGYSDANVWTILGAGWGADHSSNFFALYSQYATGTTAGYTSFLNAAYQQEFAAPPSAASLRALLGDVPGLSALLSGGGNTATPVQVMGGLYGYLLYAGQTNAIGRYAAAADAFLRAAANGTVVYGPELTQQFGSASGATALGSLLRQTPIDMAGEIAALANIPSGTAQSQGAVGVFGGGFLNFDTMVTHLAVRGA